MLIFSKRKKILIIIAILAIIILSFIGQQTYSKYTSQVNGQGVGNVANWSFKVNDNEEQLQTINLASTCTEMTVLDNKIAPGTKGRFNIVVDGTGADVGIDYETKFKNLKNLPHNLKFIYLGEELESINDLEETMSGTINATDDEKSHTFVIDWEWKYETGNTDEQKAQNDKIDTEDAKNIREFSFDIVVTAKQVRPQQL